MKRSTSKPYYVDYKFGEMISDTMLLDPLEELVYRRLYDLVLQTGDTLRDDAALAGATKAGRKWVDIRSRLVEKGLVRLVLNDTGNYLTITKCQVSLADSWSRIEAGRTGGRASSEKRNGLKSHDTGSTAVERSSNDRTNDSANDRATTGATIYQPSSKESDLSGGNSSVAGRAGARETPARPAPTDIAKGLPHILERIEQALEVAPGRYAGDWPRVSRWLQAGADVERHIVPALQGHVATLGGRLPMTLAMFEPAVLTAIKNGGVA